MQKGPPMRQISLAAWTRRPAGSKGFAWRILPPGPADSFRMTDNPKTMCRFTTSKPVGLILSIRMVAGFAEVIEREETLVAAACNQWQAAGAHFSTCRSSKGLEGGRTHSSNSLSANSFSLQVHKGVRCGKI